MELEIVEGSAEETGTSDLAFQNSLKQTPDNVVPQPRGSHKLLALPTGLVLLKRQRALENPRLQQAQSDSCEAYFTLKRSTPPSQGRYLNFDLQRQFVQLWKAVKSADKRLFLQVPRPDQLLTVLAQERGDSLAAVG